MILSDADYENNVYVHRADADVRADCVQTVTYDVTLCLPKGENYLCKYVAHITLKKIPQKQLFLDFRGVSIGNFKVNGTAVAEQGVSSFRNHKVYIPTEALKVGEDHTNIIEISIFNKYRNDGCGLHSFTDSADGEQYLYTQFEADYCHWVFPVFDQPDIKAQWTCTAVIPSVWDAVSNEFLDENSAAKAGPAIDAIKEASALFSQDFASFGDLKVLSFKQSYKISSYLYAICAGPYGFHELNAAGLPPMRIYARKSIIGDCNFEEMFKITQAGIKFYSVFFGAEYPFNKYD